MQPPTTLEQRPSDTKKWEQVVVHLRPFFSTLPSLHFEYPLQFSLHDPSNQFTTAPAARMSYGYRATSG